MSRPKMNVLLENKNENNKLEQILEIDMYYGIFYKDVPINIKTLFADSVYPPPKYKYPSGGALGHLLNLKDKLNSLYDTEDFKVHMLSKGLEVLK